MNKRANFLKRVKGVLGGATIRWSGCKRRLGERKPGMKLQPVRVSETLEVSGDVVPTLRGLLELLPTACRRILCWGAGCLSWDRSVPRHPLPIVPGHPQTHDSRALEVGLPAGSLPCSLRV